MTVKLLPKQHLEFLSLKGGCTGLSESTLVKMPHCWKSHVTAHILRIYHEHDRGWYRKNLSLPDHRLPSRGSLVMTNGDHGKGFVFYIPSSHE